MWKSSGSNGYRYVLLGGASIALMDITFAQNRAKDTER